MSCTRRSYDYAVPIRSHLHPSFFVPPPPLGRLAPFLSPSHSLAHPLFFLRGRGLRPCTPNHAFIFTWCGGTKLPSSNIIRREFRWRDCLDPRSTGTSLLRMENLTRLELAVCRPMEAALSGPRSRRCSGFLCPRVFLPIKRVGQSGSIPAALSSLSRKMHGKLAISRGEKAAGY